MSNYVSYVPDLEDEEVVNNLTFDFDKFMPTILEGEKNKIVVEKEKSSKEVPARIKDNE